MPISNIAHTVKAIIVFNGHILLQLRDNKAGISCPGHWGFFGGEVEQGETTEQALRRELYEELSLDHFQYEFCFSWENPKTKTLLDFFLVWPAVDLGMLNLQEGQTMRLFSLDDIESEQTFTHDIRYNRARMLHLFNSLQKNTDRLNHNKNIVEAN